MSRFTKLQPADGERVITCGHTWDDRDKPFHFFKIQPAMPFTRPDGTKDEATWAVLCGRCFTRHGDNFAACIRADAIWQGDEPIVEDVTN